MSDTEALLSLHRYFLQANQMRDRFDQRLVAQGGAATFDSDEWPAQFTDMALWYACLYVVVEGWQKLKLKDPEIDQLLASPDVDHLRRFRNGCFHFQSAYMPEKMQELMASPDSVSWLRALNAAFGRYLLTWLRNKNR